METGLPEHIEWDYKIEIVDGKNPSFSKIYPLNRLQLKTLREYLNEMLRKGYIQCLISLVGYPVMFVLKKNGKLRLYVDYRMLNAIIKKDQTLLPLTNELKDRLAGSNIFTALNLKGVYNLIRIKEGDE